MTRLPVDRPGYFFVTALLLSIGWGIRGNFGHEYGAMIPGALAAMAAVILSGRNDWHGRIPLFAMFGALGWSFGGSISYMQVIGYTHSGHSPSVLYGFAGLFVIGSLWAALGGAGTALAAVADRERIAALLPVLGVVFLAWWLQGVLLEPWLRSQGVSIDWYDTDWLAALLALVAAIGLALFRRGVDHGTSLVIYMAAGWWVGFVVLVLIFGLRMTPPRGDNWAGCLGMTIAALSYCLRTGLPEVGRALVVTGVLGGMGFAAASMLKLVEVTSGYETNWHSVLEQTTGFLNGLAIAVAMRGLAFRTPIIDDSPRKRWWDAPLAIGFVLLVIPYLNLRKNVAEWTRRAVPESMYGLPTWLWFDLAAIVVAVGLIALMARHRRSPLAVVPESPLGQGQGLCLLLLAIMVIGNFEKALVGFADQRLITEGVIHVNAVIATVALLAGSPGRNESQSALCHRSNLSPVRWGRLAAASVAAVMVSILLDWAIVRAIYGDRFAGHANLHIRFGPNATTQTPRSVPPKAG